MQYWLLDCSSVFLVFKVLFYSILYNFFFFLFIYFSFSCFIEFLCVVCFCVCTVIWTELHGINFMMMMMTINWRLRVKSVVAQLCKNLSVPVTTRLNAFVQLTVQYSFTTTFLKSKWYKVVSEPWTQRKASISDKKKTNMNNWTCTKYDDTDTGVDGVEPRVDVGPSGDGGQAVRQPSRVVVEHAVISAPHDRQHGQVVTTEVYRTEYFTCTLAVHRRRVNNHFSPKNFWPPCSPEQFEHSSSSSSSSSSS